MSLKCALDILRKNKIIELSPDKKSFYNFWRIDINVNEKDFRIKLLKKLENYNECIILENWLSDIESWITITTHKAIIKGLERLFEEENKIKWRGPIHTKGCKEINKIINETEKYKGTLYGHNDLGALIEIKDLEKESKELEKRLKKEKEAIDLLDKLL